MNKKRSVKMSSEHTPITLAIDARREEVQSFITHATILCDDEKPHQIIADMMLATLTVCHMQGLDHRKEVHKLVDDAFGEALRAKKILLPNAPDASEVSDGSS